MACQNDNALAMKLKTDTGLPMLLCSLLVGRGIYTAEQQQLNGTELPILAACGWQPAR